MNNPLRYVDPSGYKKAPVKEDAFIMDYANYWNRRTLYGGGSGGGLNSFFRSSGVGRNTSSWLSNDYFVKSAYREGSYSSFVTSIETAMWNKGMTITGSGFHFQSGALPTYASEYSITGNAIAEISAYAINPHTNNWDFSRFEGAAGQGGHSTANDLWNITMGGAGTLADGRSNGMHNSIYWVQKNGIPRLTRNIGNNYLLQRSNRIVGEALASSKMVAKAFTNLNITYTASEYGLSWALTGNLPTFGKGMDLFFTSVAIIPGAGWAVSGGYWVTSAGSYAVTGKWMSEQMDSWVY